MTEARIFNLVHAEARRRAAAYIVDDAPAGWRVTVKPQAKRRIQEERYHAMCGDFAAQWPFAGKHWHKDDMKRLLVDAFAEAMRQAGTPLHHDGRVVPSIDGLRVVQLGIQTGDFYVSEASQFIEYLFAFGADIGIKWSDEAKAPRTVPA
jgi:NinB protein